MRIGQFIDTSNQGGAERVLLDLCRELHDRGEEPLALHFGNPYISRECRRLGVAERLLPAHRWYKKTATLPRFAWELQAFLRHEGIDLLHSHLFGPITGAAAGARLAGIGHVGTLHDVYSVAEKPQRIRLLQLAALLGTRLVAVSQHMEQYYRRSARFPAAALRTIYNGIELPPAAAREALRRQHGLDAAAPVIVCVGRLVALKRHDLLLEAFASLAAELPAQLLIVGDGPERAALQARVAAASLDGRVRLLGERDDVPQLLAMSDVFCLCSDTEGLSCSVLEAMAAGLPAVVTAVGGNGELVADGDSGFLTPPGDAAALATALRRLLADAALRARCGKRARARAVEHFSLPATLRQYQQLYQGLSGARAAA